MTKNGGRIWAHDWENSVVDPLGERSSQTVALGLTMSSSGASASAATMQRHQEQRRADTSALADAARGQRQMPELPLTIVSDNRQIVFFWSCGTSLRSPPHAPPSGHGWFDGARRAPSNHPTPVTGSERAQPQEVPMKPREFCTPRCTAGLTESGSSRLLLLPQQQSAAALIRKLMTSSTAGGIRAATAGVRPCTATCPRLRTMCARIG